MQQNNRKDHDNTASTVPDTDKHCMESALEEERTHTYAEDHRIVREKHHDKIYTSVERINGMIRAIERRSMLAWQGAQECPVQLRILIAISDWLVDIEENMEKRIDFMNGEVEYFLWACRNEPKEVESMREDIMEDAEWTRSIPE